ncbi:MAG: glutamyl-tRNA reductase [Thermaerobacter sp.]|nr:glutamyl-tRNA reductase [Thermaerobacter sp.]
MKILAVGVNHRDAPLAVRERVALGPEMLGRAYAVRDNIRHQDGIVILSTCNRTELYVAGEVLLADVLSWWEGLVGVPRAEFSEALFWLNGIEAAEHLMRVAAGIDSMVLGETQILGQVKDAYQHAVQHGAVGRLHRLFQYAFRAGKRAHSETDIGRNALSLGHAVVELSRKVFGTVEDQSALVIGAGETARLVARHLKAQNVGDLAIANRTRTRAEALAEELGGRVVDLGCLAGAMRRADIIVSCTSAPRPLISREMAQEALRGQSHKFRFFFDMAVPRDIDPGVADLSRSIFLYDIDDVTRVVDANLAKRQREVQKVERLIAEEVVQFQEEMGASQVGPVIRSLREKAESIRQKELEKALNRLPNLSEEERAVVADTTRLILNKFLNDAMVSMRSWGKDEQKRSYVDAVRELFRLADEQADSIGADGGVALSSK